LSANKPSNLLSTADPAERALDTFESELRGTVSDGSGCLASGLGSSGSILRFPASDRKVIYTIDSLESVNTQVRMIIKARGHFPTDDAATKLIWCGQQISSRTAALG